MPSPSPLPSAPSLPDSIRRYLQEAQTDPDAVLETLKADLQRTPSDPILRLRQAIAFKCKGLLSEASDAAWQASIHAPGSRLMGALPYYIAHPDGFDAPAPPGMEEVPKQQNSRSKRTGSSILPTQDLDRMIERLLNLEIKGRIGIGTPRGSDESDSRNHYSEKAETEGMSAAPEESGQLDVASTTLISILEAQGQHKQALQLLDRLLAGNPANMEELEEQKQRLLTSIERSTRED